MSDITDKYIILGQKIKEYRKKKKLTMTELASETELSQSAISMIENGLRHPSLQTIHRISKVLGYDFSQILMNDTPDSVPNKKEALMDRLDICALQFNLSLQLVNMPSALPDKELNHLVVSSILKEAQTILNEEHIKKRVEQHVSAVIKEEIERKKRELDQTLNIFDL